jgi:mannose-1-phosphate guanylyltransferase
MTTTNPTSATWALVLAAGDGNRLRTLTASADGSHVPKQYCSFCSDRSLLGETLDRAARLAGRDRVAVVVAERHRALWEPELCDLPRRNVVAQPLNRGTANGLLLGCLRVARLDATATLVVLPSDHAFEDERALQAALRRARAATERHPDELVLLGAARLMAAGGLWSSFIMAGRLASFLRVYGRAQPSLLAAFAEATRRAEPTDATDAGLEAFYDGLPSRDFSRDVLEACTGSLRVLRAAGLGWSDLGTPERLQRALSRRRRERAPALAAGAPRRPGRRALDEALEPALA